MSQVCIARLPSQTKGKIERWHQTFKNRCPLESYSLLGGLEAQIAAFVEHYNHWRYQKSLSYRLAKYPTSVYGLRVLALDRSNRARTRQRPMPARVTVMGRSLWGSL